MCSRAKTSEHTRPLAAQSDRGAGVHYFHPSPVPEALGDTRGFTYRFEVW